MKSRKSILLIVLLLAIGFAAISTTLYINGSANINPNEDDFNVYFSDAYVNGVQNKSVIISNTTIEFTTILEELGQEYILDYEVTNGSKNYDAELEMVCTGGNEYLTVTNEFNDEDILIARDIREGILKVVLSKSYTGEDLDVSIECTINANAIERTSLNESEIATSSEYIIEGYYYDANGNIASNANLVIFSDTPHYVTTDKNGYLFYNGLEKGQHEIYYLDDTMANIKTMTKEEIISEADGSSTFKTMREENILFDNSYQISSVRLEKTDEYCASMIGTSWGYDYTNGEQQFTSKCNGIYKLETWGAQGGSHSNITGGFGGYSVGEIELEKEILLYVNVGGAGKANGTHTAHKGGYNGGGNVVIDSDSNVRTSSGGGATHIALTSGILSKLSGSIDKILIVSGGGGGCGYNSANGTPRVQTVYSGGGYIGEGVSTSGGEWAANASGGSQTSGGSYHSSNCTSTYCSKGSFGQGGKAAYSGAGGGFYGGGVSWSRGAGGSGYIANPLLTNKAMYCYNCLTTEEESIKTIKTSCSETTPTSNCAKRNNGYAKITYLGTN